MEKEIDDILVDESRGIALVKLPSYAENLKIFQLELYDFLKIYYSKEFSHDCIVIEFTESQLDLICAAWLAYKAREQK